MWNKEHGALWLLNQGKQEVDLQHQAIMADYDVDYGDVQPQCVLWVQSRNSKSAQLTISAINSPRRSAIFS